MKRILPKLLFIAILATFFLSAATCSLFYIAPKDYVSDDKVVYLVQRIDLDPIRYEPGLAEPYTWSADTSKVDPAKPKFLTKTDFASYLVPDYAADCWTYAEVKGHFGYLPDDPALLAFKNALETGNKTAPPAPRDIVKGDQVKTYSNAIEYQYPPVDNSTIDDFGNGEYMIHLGNGNTYHLQRDGAYWEEDSSKRELYYVNQAAKQWRFLVGDYKYSYMPNQSKVELRGGFYADMGGKEPQIQYKPTGVTYTYFFFFPNAHSTDLRSADEYAVGFQNGLRLDWFPETQDIYIVNNAEVVIIPKNLVKQHRGFDRSKLEPTDLLSLFFPSGLRLTDFGKALSSSILTPAWPEKYLARQMGPFTMFYTQNDAKYLGKIDGNKLNNLANLARKVTGLSFIYGRSVILPPNLESYRKLYAFDKPVQLSWYPSGFEGLDIIVMWPPSVKRYKSTQGDDYFWNVEFYDILVHELTHLMVGEQTGLISEVPVWLNEGLAVTVETTADPLTKAYWDLVFEVTYNQGRLLPWEDVTVKSTGDYPVNQARTFYAQGYAMTTYLIATYGTDKLDKYLVSFKTKPEDIVGDKLRDQFKTKFKAAFGISWEENLVKFDQWAQNWKTGKK